MESALFRSDRDLRYSVKLGVFEGPLDLLLHLIKKNRVDIYDIPIAVITEQYLEYIRVMKELNLDLAGEYLLMAATLTYIKSRTLLPIEEVDEETGEEIEDPRAELVRRLLDYQRYKEASAFFTECDMLERDVFMRGYSEMDALRNELKGSEIIEASIFQLIEAIQTIIKQSKEKIIHEVTAERVSIKEKINEITARLTAEDMFLFTSLFEGAITRSMIIATFLALLELIKLSMAKVVQTELFGPIRVLSLLKDSAGQEIESDGN